MWGSISIQTPFLLQKHITPVEEIEEEEEEEEKDPFDRLSNPLCKLREGEKSYYCDGYDSTESLDLALAVQMSLNPVEVQISGV